MKVLSLFVLFLWMGSSLLATPIDVQKARKIAEQFFSTSLRKGGIVHSSKLQLVFVAGEELRLKQSGAFRSQVGAYYIFNRGDKEGFIVVSGDDCLPEVLGYATEGYIDPQQLPVQLYSLLQAYTILIDKQQEMGHLQNVAKQTKNLRNGLPLEVAPLLRNIVWDQGYPWNFYCPFGNEEPNMPVGCVATATAQVMRQHSWPKRGAGEYEYKEFVSTRYHKVNFEVEYDWSNMPEKLYPATQCSVLQREALATLCYHVGAASDMMYDEDGSGTFLGSVVRALRTHFGYKRSLRAIDRATYITEEWEQVLRQEMAAGRSVVYGGLGYGGGHAFVCDGYDANGFFHINWGWLGTSNGYFLLNVLAPSVLGTGGGTGGFNWGQQAIVGIEPDFKGNSKDAEPELMGQSFQLTYNKDRGMLYTTELLAKLTSERDYSGSLRLRMVNESDPQEVKETKAGKKIELHYVMDPRRSNQMTSIGAYIPAFKVADLALKPNSIYKVIPQFEGHSGYFPIKHIIGTATEAFVYTDSQGNIDRIGYPENTPRLSVDARQTKCTLQGYEASSIDYILNNSGEELRNNVTFMYKVSGQSNWIELASELKSIPHGSHCFTCRIDRFPLPEGEKTDLKLVIQGKEYPLAQKVQVVRASQIRPGLLVTYNGEATLSQTIELHPQSAVIKGLKIKNVGSNPFAPFRATCYISVTNGKDLISLTKPRRFRFMEPLKESVAIDLAFSPEEIRTLIADANFFTNNPFNPGGKCWFEVLVILSEPDGKTIISPIRSVMPQVIFNSDLSLLQPVEIKLETSKKKGETVNLSFQNISEQDLQLKGISPLPKGGYKVTDDDIEIKGYLKELHCSDCGITSLKISENTTLRKLVCSNNQIEQLDLKKLSALSYLDCSHNPLKKIDLSPSLETVISAHTQLEEIDLSNLLLLATLDLSYNAIKSIDLSKTTGLISLNLSGNRLTHLALGTAIGLKELCCQGNQLTDLTLPTSPELEKVHCYNNALDLSVLQKAVQQLNDRSSLLQCGELMAINTQGQEDNQCDLSVVEEAVQKNWIILDFKGGFNQGAGVPFLKENSFCHISIEAPEECRIGAEGMDNLDKVPYGTTLSLQIEAPEYLRLFSLTANGKDIRKEKKFTILCDTKIMAEFRETTAIQMPQKNNKTIRLLPNPVTDYFVVSEAEAYTPVRLFSASGLLLFGGSTDGDGYLRVETSAIQRGFCIVQVGNAIFKVILH